MKIETIAVRNFRCFGPEWIEVRLQEQVTAFVGGNGSGKTALFQALSRIFGVTRTDRTVTKKDFHIAHDEEALPNGQALEIECLLGFPELDKEEDEDVNAVPDFFNHMAASGPDEPLKARIRLVARWIEDGTSDGTVEEDIRWITTLDKEFVWENCPRVSAVDRASIQVIYVPALRNAADRVTELLKGRLWRAALWSADLGARATEGAELIQNQFDQEAPANFIIERLTHRWQQVYEGDTDTTPNLRLIDSGIEELVRRAEFVFHPDEAGRNRNLADLSDGQRSLFHIALTAATLETEQAALALAAAESPFDQEKLRRTHLTLLAIEEPENNLSPFFLSRVVTQAREIGEMGTAQALISSHSASILSRIEADEVRFFRIDRQTRRTSVRLLTLPENDDEASAYVRLAVRSYPELYFARFVILAEGDSERIVVPRLAEAKGVPLDPSFVPVVPLGGRYVSHFWRLLTDLGIPYATLLDFDLGRAHGGANMIRTTVAALKQVGRDLTTNSLVVNRTIDLYDLDSLVDKDVLNNWQDNDWLQALRHEAVFFSDPIDLDFAMLQAFPAAYQHPNPNGRGPRTTAEAIAEKKKVVLKTNGKPDIYDDDRWDDSFAWYPYLFLSRSKPETHLAALSRITNQNLVYHAPRELSALIDHVRDVLFPEPGED
ncbi:AAA family ATPase [Bartonella sp. HY329]|uniref:ATP-dependent nuclease n=1 Tax=unclassified Bartonella TaxID=2645622 RepID=UPI0021CA586A|nr:MULTISPECIES: AAA family ATPase [unclassified Bartonella]UXM96044.1 AAA family ATPase [Bartonella sp. HY329]UXN10368.1 AAA family ATPase [Bartonella sp. HY328]